MTKCEIIMQKVEMQEVIEYYDITNSRNKNYCCPFHNDKRPSATISSDGKWFHCFACGVNYNVIDFVANFEKCSRKEAIQKLDVMFKLGLGEGASEEQKMEMRIAKLKREREKKLEEEKSMKEKLVLSKLLSKIEMWEEIQKISHLTRKEYKTCQWELSDLFFISLKEQDRLSWLYCKVAGFENDFCEYDLIYISETRESLVEKILEGKIDI